MISARHVACKEGIRNLVNTLPRKREGKSAIWRPKCRLNNENYGDDNDDDDDDIIIIVVIAFIIIIIVIILKK